MNSIPECHNYGLDIVLRRVAGGVAGSVCCWTEGSLVFTASVGAELVGEFRERCWKGGCRRNGIPL